MKRASLITTASVSLTSNRLHSTFHGSRVGLTASKWRNDAMRTDAMFANLSKMLTSNEQFQWAIRSTPYSSTYVPVLTRMADVNTCPETDPTNTWNGVSSAFHRQILGFAARWPSWQPKKVDEHPNWHSFQRGRTIQNDQTARGSSRSPMALRSRGTWRPLQHICLCTTTRSWSLTTWRLVEVAIGSSMVQLPGVWQLPCNRCLPPPRVVSRNISLYTEDSVEAHYKTRTEDIPVAYNLNIFVACFTTCWVWLRLYEAVDLLEDRVLYYYMDSVLFMQRPEEPVELGRLLGRVHWQTGHRRPHHGVLFR